MSSSALVGVSWYIRAVGVRPEDGFRWFAIDETDDPSDADSVVYRDLAGRQMVDLVSERTPSVVLGRSSDGGFVFLANRLTPPGAPAKGDYQGRAITATLLGVASPGADPSPLVAATRAAFTDELAAWLPLAWSDGQPTVDLAVGQWPPVRTAGAGVGPSEMERSVGLPPADAASVADALTGLSGEDLDGVEHDRLVALSTNVLDRNDLEELRPWRVVSPILTEQVVFDRKSGVKWNGVPANVDWKAVMAFAGILALIFGLVALISIIVQSQGRK